MSSVELKAIIKRYGDVTAVNSIDLSVGSGEFVTLLGPSGCGKTTTLRMVAGFIRPTSGTLSIAGLDMNGVPPHKRKVGLVFQNYALFPHMTVQKNVEFGLRMQKILPSDRDIRVTEALELVQLRDLANRMPGELSGGQQQRVALARALVIRPDVLLLDEPFGALDKKLRDHMRVELRELQKKLNISTLFVTHDQDEALSMSDRIVVMLDGKANQIGSPIDIYERPQTSFVADFIGRSNILSGKIETNVNGKATLNAEGLLLPLVPNIVNSGAEVSVMIRPECVKLQKTGVKVESSPRVFNVRVLSIVYLGSILQYSVQIEGGPVLLITQNNVGSSDSDKLVSGDRAEILIPDNAVYIIPC